MLVVFLICSTSSPSFFGFMFGVRGTFLGSILGALHISISFYANTEIRKMFLDKVIKTCLLHSEIYMKPHRRNILKTLIKHHRTIIGKYLKQDKITQA